MLRAMRSEWQFRRVTGAKDCKLYGSVGAVAVAWRTGCWTELPSHRRPSSSVFRGDVIRPRNPYCQERRDESLTEQRCTVFEYCRRHAWAYLRDANGGNALSKLARYEISLLREYDRSRQELEKLQKIRAAKPAPPPVAEELRREPDRPITPTKSAQPATSAPLPNTQNPAPAAAPAPEPDDDPNIPGFQWIVDRR
jgi:hypothetical protein